MTHSDDGDSGIVHRQFDTDADNPSTAVAETVAELKGVESTELGTVYDHLDHVLDHLFSNPPVAAAQVQIEFTYEGYRITMDQDGSARFIAVA